jgi:hypothetical protein
MNFSMKQIVPTALFALALIAIISAPHFHEVAEVEHEDAFGNRIMDHMKQVEAKAKAKTANAQAKVQDFQPSVFSTAPQAPVVVEPETDAVEDDEELFSIESSGASDTPDSDSPPWSQDTEDPKKLSAPVDFQPNVFVQKRHKVFSKPSKEEGAPSAKKVSTFQPRVFQPKQEASTSAAPKPAAKRTAQKKVHHAPHHPPHRAPPKRAASRTAFHAPPSAPHLRHASTLAHRLPKEDDVDDVDTPDDSALRHMRAHESKMKKVKPLESHVLQDQAKKKKEQEHSAKDKPKPKKTTVKKAKKHEEAVMDELLSAQEPADRVTSNHKNTGEVDGNEVLSMFDEEAEDERNQIPEDDAEARPLVVQDKFGDDDVLEEVVVAPKRSAAPAPTETASLMASIPKFHPEEAAENVVTSSDDVIQSSDVVSTFEPRVFSHGPTLAVAKPFVSPQDDAALVTPPRGGDGGADLLLEKEETRGPVEKPVEKKAVERKLKTAEPPAAAKEEAVRPSFSHLLSNLKNGGGFTAGKDVASEFFQPDVDASSTKEEAFPDGSSATTMWNDIGLDDDGSPNEFSVDDKNSAVKKSQTAQDALDMLNDDDAIEDEARVNDPVMAAQPETHDLVLDDVQPDVESDLSVMTGQMLD